MTDFAVYHRSATPSTTPANGYRAGDLVSAKFSVDNAWYRAKIRKNFPHKKEAEVVFIDYGNSEVVAHGNIRSLDPRFKSLPAQAKEATLSFVKLLGPDTEYGQEALDRFRSLVEVRRSLLFLPTFDVHTVIFKCFPPQMCRARH
jgi:staphylococcal nuclease domain-containing protein 1